MINHKDRRIDNLAASLKLIGFREYHTSINNVLNKNISLQYTLSDERILSVNLLRRENIYDVMIRQINSIGVIESQNDIDNKSLSRIIDILDNTSAII